ncbi:MAG: glycosyl hydrolase family 67, partial [Chitinivibrionales bacterium]|nr:glycosyl hydrolase family 67 [Chitinivibrionales bacterium]MBD3358718.1 glycosyl hydrolase family 67 [Chitinivibrionales bacterium]
MTINKPTLVTRPKLFLIDCTAPFFATCRPEGSETNWSKIPFVRLEQSGVLTERKDELLESFERYVRTVSRIGYNVITFDDVAHLVQHSFYSSELNARIAAYQALYAKLFALASSYGLKILVNTDILPTNAAIEAHTGMKPVPLTRFFHRSIRRLLKMFPQIEGVVMRLGEADGIDVQGDFHSKLVIRTTRQCRRLIRTILPLFERQKKLLIVRTWTLGAFPVGDLIWNKDTYDAVFRGIESESLVVSQKYGEADFFRYLNLNPLFYYGSHQKIIELQARREYEGFGEFPSYIGPDCERYSRYSSMCENLIGISVW